jgi:hypothetical protein
MENTFCEVFGSILTPINLNTNWSNSKRKCFENELRENSQFSKY